MPIYTRTGDTGSTSLFGGKRVLKCEELIDVYGSIDELNSWIGLIVSKITDKDSVNFLRDVQADLFVIGSMMAGWHGTLDNLKVCAEDMEVWIDTMDKELTTLNNFILPGGTTVASWTHLARAVCRRVERQVVSLSRKEEREAHLTEAYLNFIIKYLNRLSDLLFVLARFINKQANAEELVWSGSVKTKVNKK